MRSLLPALLLLTGCIFEPSYTSHSAIKDATIVPVYINGFERPDVERTLKEAVAEWNIALNGHMYLRFMNDNSDPATICEHARSNNEIVVMAADVNMPNRGMYMLKASHFDGAIAVNMPWGTKKPAALIYVINTLPPLTAKYVLLHELAHSFGADDIEEPGHGLMSVNYSGVRCIDKATMVQVSKAMGYDLQTTNWCE